MSIGEIRTLRQETGDFLEKHAEWLVRLEGLRLAMTKETYEAAEWLDGTRELLAASNLLMGWLLEGLDEEDLFELTIMEAIRRV